MERVNMQNVVAEGLEGTERVWEPSVDEEHRMLSRGEQDRQEQHS